MTNKTELATFLESIGIDLKGEERPYLKTEILTKRVKVKQEKRVGGKMIKEEIEVDEEYAREYCIFPYSEMSEKKPKNPILVVDAKSDIGKQITEYNKQLFNKVAYAQPEPFHISQISGFK